MERLRVPEDAAALEANERAAQADAEAKKKVAEQLERWRLHFVVRSMQVSEECIKKGLEILGLSVADCSPAEAARLLAVAHNIGAAVTGLPGTRCQCQWTTIVAINR